MCIMIQNLLSHLVFLEHRVSNQLRRGKSPSIVQCIYNLWSQNVPKENNTANWSVRLDK